MYYREFYYWCRDAVSQIRYRPDREKVYTELRGHMQDRYESYLAEGMDEKEAEIKTLAAMGDAKELAPQLAAIHKPHWAYAMVITRFLAFILIMAIVISGVSLAVKRLEVDGWQDWFDWPDDPWDPYTEGNGTQVAYVTPKDVTDSTDGYYFKVKKAVMWQQEDAPAAENGICYGQLYVRLNVTNLLPWMSQLPAVHWMWAVDSAGTYYTSKNEQNPTTQAWITPMLDGDRLWTQSYDVYFQGAPADIQWVELHYDRDGRDILLHIDLSGGGT